MIVSQAEIDLVRRGKRFQMMLPMERGGAGELLPCPVEEGQCVSLQPRQFARGLQVTIIKIEASTLDKLTDQHAKRQGYASLADQRAAWNGTEQVWLAHFARGDHSAFYRQHRERYLKAKGVGLTDDPKRAVKSEPAVTEAEQLEIARKARSIRVEEERAKIKNVRLGLKVLLADLRSLEPSEDTRAEIRRTETRIGKLEKMLEHDDDALAGRTHRDRPYEECAA
ncbi:MAG: hypothetical protein ACRDK4_04920 [Solirubrobacteraceae bacterium]